MVTPHPTATRPSAVAITRGFRELTAISHLGPAVATLARMKETDPHRLWADNCQELLDAAREARAANSRTLWAERIQVATFAGREQSITEMVDYACRITERFLEHAPFCERDLRWRASC